MKQPRARLLVFNDPHPMRVEKELAAEIGLNESILFLQIEFLISISRHEQDGRLWTYQSLQELHDNYFPWWSLATISRIVKALQKLELLIVGNYNKSGFDRTQWFALNEEGINRLQSVKLQPVPILQNEKRNLQNGEMDVDKMQNRSSQNETTIPETTSETTQSGGVANASQTTPPPQLAASDDALRSLLGPTVKQYRDIHAAHGPLTDEEIEDLPFWLDDLKRAGRRNPNGVVISALSSGQTVPRRKGRPSTVTPEQAALTADRLKRDEEWNKKYGKDLYAPLSC